MTPSGPSTASSATVTSHPASSPARTGYGATIGVAALLQSTGDGRCLFVAGCAANQRRFRNEFDHVVLLTAPVQVRLERLATRTTDPFGKHPDERSKILTDKADVEPMLRAGAGLVIETTEPVEATVQRLLDLLAL